MPDFEGFPISSQVPEAKFEVECYQLLHAEPKILASRLLHYRIPMQHPGARVNTPEDLAGRRLFVFERADGTNNVWQELSAEQKASLLKHLAQIRAALFHFELPIDFAARYLRERLFEQKPKSLPLQVAATREFRISVFTSKIEATIRNIGDMIGWEYDNNVVGPIAFAAKQSLLRTIPYILPPDCSETSLYRLVLEHGDFGIHNTSIAIDANGHPHVTSLYDWETGCIVPATLSDPLVAAGPIDIITDSNGDPAITRIPRESSLADHEEYATWADQYLQELVRQAPDYLTAIKAGKHARHLWFALRDWRGDDPEAFFGDLGAWAEKTLRELGIA